MNAQIQGEEIKAWQYEKEAQQLEKELKKEKFSTFFVFEKEKLMSFSEYIMKLEEEKKETLFQLAESTGQGNYKPIEQWNIVEINDYLEKKKKQIEKINQKLNYERN